MSRSFSLQPASPQTLDFHQLLQKTNRMSRPTVVVGTRQPLVSLRPCAYSNRRLVGAVWACLQT
jgi:hypothetical protein